MNAFFRGFDGRDGYAAALALQAVYALDWKSAAAAFSGVEQPVTVLDSGSLSDAVPSFALLASPDYLLVCVVGTQNTTQGILDVVGSAQVQLGTFPGQVGAYWATAALALWGRLAPTIAAHLGSRSIVFLGHSLGGAICECMTWLSIHEFNQAPTVCWTFGAPRPGDPNFAAGVGDFVNRWENVGDPIPSIPPEAWNGIGSLWPFSGPPPLPTWSHPGQATTVDAQGHWTAGSFPMTTLQAAATLASLQMEAHSIGAYASRLRAPLTAEQLSPPQSGFVEPVVLDVYLNFSQRGASMATPNAPQAAATYYKVTLFYQYGIAGMTESFWTTTPPNIIRTVLVPGYLDVRMALAVDLFQFLYARISNVATPRLVDFVSNEQDGITRYGKISTGLNIKSLPAERGAADSSAVLFRMKLTGGPSARIFLHGFDNAQDNQGTFTPNGNWTEKIIAFLAFLQGGGNNIFYQWTLPPGLNSRILITQIAPGNPRGALITMQRAQAFTLGQYVTIGGVPSAMQGINGRKIVISQTDATNMTFNCGGAVPVGTYAGTGGYLYLVQPQFAPVQYAIGERLTSHRVGRPFAEPVGRKHPRLPLRR